MLAYIGRRALLAIFTVWAISVLSFAIIQLPPGDYVTSYIAQMASMGSVVSDEEAQNLRIQYGLGQPDIRLGDVALFSALIATLDLPSAWKRRLVKDFNRKANLASDLDQLARNAARDRPAYQGVLAALAGSDPQAAHDDPHSTAARCRQRHSRPARDAHADEREHGNSQDVGDGHAARFASCGRSRAAPDRGRR